MNKISTMHLHTRYSDGLNDAYEYIEEAIRLGLKSIGISDHSPTPFESNWAMKKEDLPKYIKELDCLKKEYKSYINVYAGLELDYIQNLDVKKYIDFEQLNLDYSIGSVHYIYSDIWGDYGTVDNSQEDVDDLFIKGFNKDSTLFVERYYETVREMINAYDPILIAHIDVLEKRNIKRTLFNPNTNEYKEQVEKTLDCVNHSCVEVNTGAMSKDIDVLYPSEYILKSCLQKNIPISINSDCHFISGLLFGYDEALSLLRKIGYKEVYYFDGKMKRTDI